MTDTNKRATKTMNERLDYLLSVALDDELDTDEREELARLLPAPVAAAERRAHLASVDKIVQSLAASSILSDGANHSQRSAAAELEDGLVAIRARLEADEAKASIDALGRRRRRIPKWIPPVAMAAAAAAIYLVIHQASFDSLMIRDSASSVDVPTPGEGRLIDEPIALAVVFEVEDDGDSLGLVDGVSPDDFEIIETLELMEFLESRHHKESRG